MDERARIYVRTERRNRGMRRATHFLFLAIVAVVLAGMFAGLKPELEKSRQLDRAIAAHREKVELAKAELRAAEKRQSYLMMADPGYVEQEYRRLHPRAAKPGETLLMLSEEQMAAYDSGAEKVSP